MTKGLAAIWKDAAERVLKGEREENELVKDVSDAILKDPAMTRETVVQLVRKRIRDMIAGAVKETGKTSRVPAGQQDLGWLDLEPVFAITRLRRQVKLAYAAAARAALHAQLLGVIDASGLEPTGYKTFRELCEAANVPNELMTALSA